MYNKDTFYREPTQAIWKQVPTKEWFNLLRNEEWEHSPTSSSRYLYTEEGVYRYRDHFTFNVGKSAWLIVYHGKRNPCVHDKTRATLAFVKWEDIHPLNEENPLMEPLASIKLARDTRDERLAQKQERHLNRFRRKKIPFSITLPDGTIIGPVRFFSESKRSIRFTHPEGDIFSLSKATLLKSKAH